MSAIKLYTFPLSGHSHRVELFLSLLGLEAELINLDLANGEHKTPEFLAKNPAGQIPVLEDGDITLADSNAILLYLANKYDAKRNWYPEDLLQQVEIQKYFSLAAGKLTFGPCNARLINVFGAALDKSFASSAIVDWQEKLDNSSRCRCNDALLKSTCPKGCSPKLASCSSLPVKLLSGKILRAKTWGTLSQYKSTSRTNIGSPSVIRWHASSAEQACCISPITFT